MTEWLSPDGISALATGAGVLVALLFFFWEKRAARAKLGIRLHHGSPAWGGVSVGENENTEYLYLIRLAVTNSGPAPARGVEAVVHELEVEEEGRWRALGTFLPTPLCWTHVGEGTLGMLVPGTERLVDLATISRRGSVMMLNVTPQPRSAYNYLNVGKRHRFRLTLAAENAPAVSKRLVIGFSGTWDPADDVMARSVELVESA